MYIKITERMVDAAVAKYAMLDDGAIFPDDYSEEEVQYERRKMREILEAVLGAIE